MSQAFSSSRPLNAEDAQTPQFQKLQNYAYGNAIQDMMQKMMTDVFTDQPEDALEYMLSWLAAEKRRRGLQSGTATLAQD